MLSSRIHTHTRHMRRWMAVREGTHDLRANGVVDGGDDDDVVELVSYFFFANFCRCCLPTRAKMALNVDSTLKDEMQSIIRRKRDEWIERIRRSKATKQWTITAKDTYYANNAGDAFWKRKREENEQFRVRVDSLTFGLRVTCASSSLENENTDWINQGR